MDAVTFAAKLGTLGACHAARIWVDGKSASQAWDDCQRPDWMLWALCCTGLPARTYALIAVDIAEHCCHLANGIPAVAKCIQVTRAYLAGTASSDELTAAAAAKSAAYAAYYAAYAADAYYAAYAAYYAAYAADAYYAADAAAAKSAAAIIRRHVPAAEFVRLFTEINK